MFQRGGAVWRHGVLQCFQGDRCKDGPHEPVMASVKYSWQSLWAGPPMLLAGGRTITTVAKEQGVEGGRPSGSHSLGKQRRASYVLTAHPLTAFPAPKTQDAQCHTRARASYVLTAHPLTAFPASKTQDAQCHTRARAKNT